MPSTPGAALRFREPKLSRNRSTVRPFVTFVMLKTGAVAFVRLSVFVPVVPAPNESLASVKSGVSGAAGVLVSIVSGVSGVEALLIALPLTVCFALY